jgi:GT2 family glycosyltransferase
VQQRLSELWLGAQRTWHEEGARGFGQRLWRWLKGERRYYRQAGADAPMPPVGIAGAVQVVQRASEPLAPLVSVLIPVHNALDYVRECLESLFAAAIAHPYEVILIDNASDADTAAWLEDFARAHPAVTLLRLDTNAGYGGGMNIGAPYARGEFLLLSNSDVLFTDHSIDALVHTLQTDLTIGVASPLTNYVGEGPQKAAEAEGLAPAQAGNFAQSVRERDSLLFPPERLVFFCVLMRRSVFRLLNGFAPDYHLGNYEDEDFCARLLLLSLRLAIVERSFIYHYGSKTFAANAIDHTRLMTTNVALYHGRLAEHATSDAALALRRRLWPTPITSFPAPLISVIIRTRNRPHTLRNALRSLAMQHETAFEAVVVNDGGDDVSALLHEFEPYFPIQYLTHDAPRLASGASNTGVAAMRGDFYIHLDDDDIVYPHHLQSFAWLHARHPEGRVLYSHYNRVLMQEVEERFIPLERVYPPPWTFDAEALLYSNFIVIHSALIHRGVADAVGPYDPALEILQDWDYLIRASRHTAFIPLGRVTCEYRFYLGLSNSLTGRRERVMQEMHQIYNAYPTLDRTILAQRELNTRGQAKQLAYTRKLEARVAAGRLRRVQANAAILNQTLGFRIPPHLAVDDPALIANG